MITSARRVLPCGEHAVIIECIDTADAVGLSRALRMDEQLNSGLIREIVPGARTVLVRFARRVSDDIVTDLAGHTALSMTDHLGPEVEIEVDYDGEDLAEVAALLRIDADEVITRHTAQSWTVAFCGFAPGFGYLLGEHDDLRVPRRATPRTKVPAGAVGLADRWSGMYPREGPGGWQLIGRTRRVLWDLSADPPALLQPGSTVRFVAA